MSRLRLLRHWCRLCMCGLSNLIENAGRRGCDVKTSLCGGNGFGQMRQWGGEQQRGRGGNEKGNGVEPGLYTAAGCGDGGRLEVETAADRRRRRRQTGGRDGSRLEAETAPAPAVTKVGEGGVGGKDSDGDGDRGKR